MYVHRLWLTYETRAPSARQNPISAQRNARVFDKDPEQVEFARRHLELAAFDLSAATGGVEPQTADLDNRVRPRGNPFPEEGAHLGANQPRSAVRRQPCIGSNRKAGRCHMVVGPNHKQWRGRRSSNRRRGIH
jgi:hypothetical protein